MAGMVSAGWSRAITCRPSDVESSASYGTRSFKKSLRIRHEKKELDVFHIAGDNPCYIFPSLWFLYLFAFMFGLTPGYGPESMYFRCWISRVRCWLLVSA